MGRAWRARPRRCPAPVVTPKPMRWLIGNGKLLTPRLHRNLLLGQQSFTSRPREPSFDMPSATTPSRCTYPRVFVPNSAQRSMPWLTTTALSLSLFRRLVVPAMTAKLSCRAGEHRQWP